MEFLSTAPLKHQDSTDSGHDGIPISGRSLLCLTAQKFLQYIRFRDKPSVELGIFIGDHEKHAHLTQADFRLLRN